MMLRFIVFILSLSVTSGLRLMNNDDAKNLPETDMTENNGVKRTALRLAGQGPPQKGQQWSRVEHDQDASKAASRIGYVVGISPSPRSALHGNYQDTRRNQHQATNIPRNGHIAILMHGEIFRGLIPGCKKYYQEKCKASCSETNRDCTFKAADSVRHNIIEHFLTYNNSVDLFMVTRPCELVPNLLSRYDLTPKTKLFDSRTQGEGVNAVFDLLIQSVADEAFAYDTLILTRTDVVFQKPLLSSTVLNLSSINFASPCESWSSYKDCVNDVFITMPGHFIQSFRDVACFDKNGHSCKQKLADTVADAGFRFGYTFWDEPQTLVRGANDWYSIC